MKIRFFYNQFKHVLKFDKPYSSAYNQSMLKSLKIPIEANEIIKTLNEAGFECFLVGGCVRDFVLGEPYKDLDLTTNATPNEVERVLSEYKIFETGLKHGTVTVIVNSKPIEITTYRIDGKYEDFRHPKSVTFTRNLIDDLKRRDFTINALAYDGKNIIDEFGGVGDIKNKIIRCVGNASERFKEDPLRILRAIRFSSVLGFTIEENTKKAMFELEHLLKHVSFERIRVEFEKTLLGKNAKSAMIEYVDIFGVVIPELLTMKGFDQHNPHHRYDVLTHTCVALDGATCDKNIRLAVMFHDIGKPASFSLINGVGHFYGHAQKSYEISGKILRRLKYDNKTIEYVIKLIKHHDLDLQATEKYINRLVYKLGNVEIVKDLVLLQRADNFGQAPIHNERIEKFDKIDEILKSIEEKQLSFSLKDLKVNGKDMLSLGLKGKEIGDALIFLLNAVLDEKVENKKENLLKFLKQNLK